MTDEKKKMTAQGSSVGADDGQSISQITENSIPTSGQKSNDEINCCWTAAFIEKPPQGWEDESFP